MTVKPPRVRCAVYCRKSSDDGLEQAFNSLNAQRDAAESYIRSRVSQGWVCLPEVYEDGGFSGGTLERPALTRLLAAIEARTVDAVVVYRLDRFSRSLKDFGKLMDLLNAANVAIVSVTESLDSSSASGRLMLNLLLSFAQYERELASDRTRDKIAASRKRGLWTGGRPVLGYDLQDCKLQINAEEAVVVRHLYGRYLELKSLSSLVEDLRSRGVNNKSWVAKDGKQRGGGPFHKSSLHNLLRCPLYRGLVPHKGTLHPGAHEAIVPPETFERVQCLLAENGRGGASLIRNTFGGLLKGLLVCGACSAPMVHTTTRATSGVTHRYYVCRTRQICGANKCRGGSVPAGQIEDFVIEKAMDVVCDPELVRATADICRARADERVRDLDARRLLALSERDASALEHRKANEPSAAVRQRIAAEAVTALEAEIAKVQAGVPNLRAATMAIEEFEGIWASLSPTERAMLLSAVVERVVCDPGKGEVRIRLRSAVARVGEGLS